MQEIHDLHKGFLRLIFTGDILKGHAGLLLYINLCIVLAHSHGAAAAAHLFKHKRQQKPEQGHRQNNGNDDLPDAGFVAQHTVSVDSVRLQTGGQRIHILHEDRIILLAGLRCAEQIHRGEQRRRLRLGPLLLILLEGEEDRTRGAHLHILHRILLDVLEELRIRHLFPGVPISPEHCAQEIHCHHCGDQRHDQRHGVRPPGTVVIVVIVIILPAAGCILAVVLIHPAAVIEKGKLSVHSNSVSFCTLHSPQKPRGH